jgi:hypothetical protein
VPERGTEKRGEHRWPSKTAAWIAALFAFFLLIAAPLLPRRRLANPTRTSWPLAPVWQGSGILHAANRSAYPLYMKLRFERKREGSGTADGKTSLIGTATFVLLENLRSIWTYAALSMPGGSRTEKQCPSIFVLKKIQTPNYFFCFMARGKVRNWC